MSKINDGGPAYPLQSIGPDFAPGYSGMSLRDWFAGQALAGDWAAQGGDMGAYRDAEPQENLVARAACPSSEHLAQIAA